MLRRSLNPRIVYAVLISLLTTWTWGCASYNTRQVQIDSKSPRAESSGGTLCLYLDEYASETKCKQAFDSELTQEGVLPILVKIENNSQDSYEVAAKDCKITGSADLRPLTPAEAAKKAKRDAVGRAIGWSLIVPIVAIPVAAVASASHTKDVNNKIQQDFNAKALKDGVILPNKELSGFLFYELPPGQKDLSGLELNITAKKQSTLEPISLVTPLPNANFKPAKDPSKASETVENPGYGHK